MAVHPDTGPGELSEPWTAIRAESLRPSLRQIVGRVVAVTVIDALVLMFLAWILPGFTLDNWSDAVLAGLVVGLLNAFVWPAVAFITVPLSVLTLGVGAIVLNAVAIGVVLDLLPGSHVTGFWAALAVTVGLTVSTTVLSAGLAVSDTAWTDQRMARRARRARRGPRPTVVTDVPGIVFIQIDGLAEPVLRRSLATGDVPTLHRWIREGSHHVTGWETDWSSQTGVSQCGILHGSTADMPAFRWVEKQTGSLFVSNHPRWASEIERRHSDGRGLLANDGSSYGNLFSGDADRAVMTMSGAGRVKEGKVGAGYGHYFAQPSNAVRTAVATVLEIALERRAAADQRRRDVEPRVARGWAYAGLRAFTTVINRDVCVHGVLGDIAEGRSAIYVDLLGYDEVAHHSGLERADSLAVLRNLDGQVARIERSLRWAPRPYHVVVLSDHGQTQGATFENQFGETLEELIERLTGIESAGDSDSDDGNTESTAWLRGVRGQDDKPADGLTDKLTVLASGSLGLVYFPGTDRLTLEAIERRHPGLVDELRYHPGIGLVLARTESGGSVVLGPAGQRTLGATEADDVVEGEDPLAVFGARAADKVRRVDAYSNVADLMINGRYDPELDEVPAFEDQVSSHGGLGGPQTHPFVLYPASFEMPPDVEGAAQLHRVLKGWLAAVGQTIDLTTDDRAAVLHDPYMARHGADDPVEGRP